MNEKEITVITKNALNKKYNQLIEYIEAKIRKRAEEGCFNYFIFRDEALENAFFECFWELENYWNSIDFYFSEKGFSTVKTQDIFMVLWGMSKEEYLAIQIEKNKK